MPDYCNIDNGDVVCDMHLDIVENGLPFGDDSIEEIMAENFFCMIDATCFVLNECHRVLMKDGLLNMLMFDAGKYPELYFQDPNHRRGFTRETYHYFEKDHQHYNNFGRVYGYDPWILKNIKEEGQCLRTFMTPVK